MALACIQHCLILNANDTTKELVEFSEMTGIVKAGSGLRNGGRKQVGPTMEDRRVLTIWLWD
jgi:hypothetical protein